MAVDIAQAHRRACEAAGQRVRAVRGRDQWRRPTPCTEWDVRALVNHMLYGTLWVPPLVEGKTIAEVGDRFEGDVLGDDPWGAWDRAAEPACVAFEVEGALDRIVHLSFGDVPARAYAEERFMDLLIHAWDLARGVGSDESLDPELVELCFDVLAPREDAWRAAGALGPTVMVPVGADRQTELLARFGREP